jgi:squalene synthase HpnC
MNSPIPEDLRTAYDQCEKLAFSHYENFPVASLLLPKESRPHVAALYAFARTADDFADEEAFEGKRLPLLNLWEKQLKAAMKGKKAPLVLQAFAHTLKTFQIPLSLPLDLLRAFRMDTALHRYSSWHSLLYYCRHSANPVGRMVLFIHGFREQKLHQYSDFICSGLQLINFWQDTGMDLKRNRIYYPLQELKKAGLTEKRLLVLKDSAQVRQLVKNAVEYTENYYRRGLPLLDSVSGRLSLELKATYLGGQGILNKIKSMDYNVIHHRPAWTTGDKFFLILRALFGRVHP